MSQENTNWSQSVAGVCIKDGKVLLARHTYGAGKGKLIIPGGYLENGESPEDAVKREYREEVGIHVEPRELIGIRFNAHDWYAVFRVEYISRAAREDVPELTKRMIESAQKEHPFVKTPYSGKNPPYSLYTIL